MTGRPGTRRAGAGAAPAQIAKAALRRLRWSRLEPTPENYARAYQAERGAPESRRGADSGEAWAAS